MRREKPNIEKGRAIAGILHSFNMTVSDNREIFFEGSKGVLEYNENSVKLNTGRCIVAFSGRGINISRMNEYGLTVSGFITSIEFIM